MNMKNFNLDKEGPYQLVLKIIAILPSRTQDIVKKRFGLNNNNPKTLEAVGRDYEVTRERIRQIIEVALKTVKKQPVLKIADVFMKQAEQILRQSGGIDESERFLTKIDKQFKKSKGNLSAIRFLLELNPDFSFEEENNLCNNFWHFSRISKDKIYKNIKDIEGLFKKKQLTCLIDEILASVRNNISSNVNRDELRAYLEISKKVGMNPFGEYGLFDWMEIDPSGSRDRAYLIMKHSKEPLHFSDITKRLNKYNEISIPASVASHSWQKKVCVQTVHNELIRDSRFVLIGRGIYALGEWGYKPGKIIDVIKDILKEAGKPLKQEIIVKEVKKRRMAKDNTIILNLHNKRYFKKLPNQYYSLVRPYFERSPACAGREKKGSSKQKEEGPYKILEV